MILALAIFIYTLLALLAVRIYAEKEAIQDFKKIIADGSKNSLGSKFHRQSFIRVALICAAFGLPIALYSILLFVVYWILSGFLFAYIFEPKLNILRGLAPNYVGIRSDWDLFFQRFPNPSDAVLSVKVTGMVVFGMLYCLILFFKLNIL